MTKTRTSKPKETERTSFMFRSLHQKVFDVVSDEIPSTHFHGHNSKKGSNHEYPTHVQGRFRCNNNICATGGWGSKKVAILIRGDPNNGYNAVVFNQRCGACNQLGYLTLDEESYVDRIVYRIKKWAGVPVESMPYNQRKGPPHKASLCEGCKRGICGERDTLNIHQGLRL